MANLQIKIGNKINRLIFVSETENTKTNHKMGIFRCDCGNEVTTRIYRVVHETCKSCGCLNKEMAREMCKGKISKTHGLTIKGSPESYIYNVRNSIKSRCYNKKCKEYKWYGARGIKLCEQWKLDPVSFVNWCLSNGYKKGLHIDRIDNDKDYSPENCRFVTSKENMNNTSSNVYIEYKGAKMTLTQISELTNISCFAIRYRMTNKGMTIEEAVS